MIKLTIGNQRGGVGKTTTAIAVSRCLADHGKRVLLIDADPQGSVGSMLRLKPELFLNDFLFGKRKFSDCIQQPCKNLDILCGNRDTVEAEQRAISQLGRERLFEFAFTPIESSYDAVVIDVGPSISLMQICAVVYTTNFLIPVSMDTISVSGATAFLTHAAEIRDLVAKPTRALGILPTVVDHRYGLTETVLGMITKICERHDIPMLNGIRTDSSIGKAMRARQFLADLDPKSKALEDYKAVSAKIIQMLEVEEVVSNDEPTAHVA